jgi:hypothetical protein
VWEKNSPEGGAGKFSESPYRKALGAIEPGKTHARANLIDPFSSANQAAPLACLGDMRPETSFGFRWVKLQKLAQKVGQMQLVQAHVDRVSLCASETPEEVLGTRGWFIRWARRQSDGRRRGIPEVIE